MSGITRVRDFGLRTALLLVLMACLPSAWSGLPPVQIARSPLLAGQDKPRPNLLLSLSIEFPAVAAAYRGEHGTYDRTFEYPGYFNPLKCYAYNGGNRNLTDDGYFFIAKNADTVHECGGDTFSGNFMNWAASSMLDMLRYALTGGDRVIDTADTTILQRAVLKGGDSDNFYAHRTYFPRRVVIAGGDVSAPGRVTPFNVKTLYVVSCRNRILFSDSSSGLAGDNGNDSREADGFCTASYDGKGKPGPEALDKKLGEYLVRVKVCDSKEGSARTDLCQKYGSNYKPVGEIQRRSDRLRMAVMSYVLDGSPNRYGGVLRSPMKYLGPTAPDLSGLTERGNERAEWDPVTGILYSNPDDPAARNSRSANSGLINYINKFGRSGNYKTYDPLSELYYEGIRYLQGLPPTPEATAGVSEVMRDGFPVIASWTDPVIAACQKNYLLAIADANTYWDRYLPGNEGTWYGDGGDAYDAARRIDTGIAGRTPALDVRAWTRKVGEMEMAARADYPASMAGFRLNALDAMEAGANRHGSYYIAGLAHWAYANDIRLDKPGRVTTLAVDIDEGGNGLLDGSTRLPGPRDSQLYLAAKYGGPAGRETVPNPFFTQSTGGSSAGRRKPAPVGAEGIYPANYFLASQPGAMIRSLRKAFARSGSMTGTLSAAALSAPRLSAGGEYLYQAEFDPMTWSGSLTKLALSPDDNGSVKVDSAAEWDAGEILTGTGGKPGFPRPDERKIYTSRTEAGKTLATVAFEWDKLTNSQKAALNLSPVENMNDGLGEKRLEYLRGHRELEIGQASGIFRMRERLLGDIVNSNPLYVGAPARNMQGSGYQQFLNEYRNRPRTIYVGSNDGMLHAFSAADGTELFAYVPNALFKHLNQLTHPAYAHRSYVDGQLAASEALVRGDWKTVLAGGMGAGAQGVFALDVSDPSDFAGGSGALWEFTDADDPDMGNLIGAPAIGKFLLKIVNGVPEYGYFVVVPSGVNNHVDDGAGRFNTDAAGALFLLSLDKPPSAKWQQGVNYFKFRAPSQDPSLPNGLAPPALVVGADDAVHYAYAGDLQGNLWRFDFSGSAPWSKALASKSPVFVAKDGRGMRQPITMQPKVMFAPGKGYVVLFGTGKFIEESDLSPSGFSQQSFYAIYDTTESKYSIAGRDQLVARKTEKTTGDGLRITGDLFSYGAAEGQKRGWYLDFPDAGSSGERSVTPPILADGSLLFNSLIPPGGMCSPGGGRSYMLDSLTGFALGGNSTGYLSQAGMLKPPTKIATATETGDRNPVGRKVARRRYTVINFGSDEEVKPGVAPASQIIRESLVPAGRLSWREILNWKELRDAFNKK
ncbi:pilus assembly protein [Noviherbaspirillum massiliense]|uniref:pilus assembly protein n=1 Tax=Noviherbaspirillum massiliense TaxID=1465823 RepID=UPI0003099CA9|nr:PilC/PilY family type IV pilus protein [Noviherbaspirillum massiliense]